MKYVASLRVLAVAVLAVFVSGCSAGAPQQPAKADGTSPTAAPQAKAATVIKLGHALEDKHPQNLGALRFAELVSQKTSGKVEVQVFPSGGLGDDRALQEAVGNGTIQMAVVGNTTGIAPKTEVFRLPFIFQGPEHAYRVLDGPVGEEVYSGLIANGIRVLTVYDNGFRQVTNSKRPITKLADFKGLKLRVPESKIYISTFNAIGANPTPMAFGEVYSGLQQGVIDGQENPLATIYTSKMQEVQKHLAITNHMYTSAPVIISESFWKSLPADIQKAIRDAATESRSFNREKFRSLEDEYLTELKKAGMTVTSVDQKELQNAVEPVYGEFEARIGKDLIKKVKNAE